MKKLITMAVVMVLMLSFSVNAYAIYFVPSTKVLTQLDKDVATKFYNELKFDVSQASKGIITIKLPVVKDRKKYLYWIDQGSLDSDGAVVDGLNVGGNVVAIDEKRSTVDTKISLKYASEFTVYFCNDITGRMICKEFYRYYPGETTIRHLDAATLKIPVKDENGIIIRWINTTGYMVESPVSKFTDITAGFWALNVINRLSDLKYIAGYHDSTFRPDKNISKAEFTVILGNILSDKYPRGITFDHSSEKAILPEKHWSNGVVTQTFKYMAANDMDKIFKGNFKPDDDITREEVVAILSSTLGNHPNFKQSSGSSVVLSDKNNSNYTDCIDFSVSNGLVNGYPDGTFKPQNKITRAEVAAVMVRVIDKF